jgi:DNA-directed RNA polymerase
MPILSRKQRTAFPSNFVHSLDATHMIMSAITCKEHGLNFAAANDSFWTHACDIDIMNKVLCEQFIKLHKQSIMENLRNEFIERYKDHMIPASVLKKVSPKKTELLDFESTTLMNPLDLDDEAEDLFDGVVSEPEYDDIPLESTMTQTEEPEPEFEPVRKKGGTKKREELRKEHWVPIEFPPLPPRKRSDITQAGKNRRFFY